jgi:uncharacterized damage-inducible protein DinB
MVRPIADQFRLNTDLLLNCLEGMTEAERLFRPAPGINHAAFLTAHLIDTRHFLATLLGAATENPLASLLAQAKGLDDVPDFPSSAPLASAWEAIGRHLDRAFAELTPEDLERATPQRLPGSDGTLRGGIAFLLQHESYHLGQIALLRRMLGHPAMSYRRREVG